MSNDVVASGSGLERFLHRASVVSGLPSQDIAAVLSLPSKTLTIEIGQSLYGLVATDALLLVDTGLVTQSCNLTTTEQRIIDYFVPGEIANLPRAFGDQASATFYAHANTTIVVVSQTELLEATRNEPKLLRAFLREIAVEARRARDWLINLGNRRAYARIAHFFLEFAARMDEAGLGGNGSYEMPFNQPLLSEMLGLSLVHTNKSYRLLAEAGLVFATKRHLTILDYDGLRLAGCRTSLAAQRRSVSLKGRAQEGAPHIKNAPPHGKARTQENGFVKVP